MAVGSCRGMSVQMVQADRHPAQLAVELDAVLAAIAQKARLPALSVDIDIGGSRISRAYRDGSQRVVGEGRPVFQSGCLMDIFLAIVCLDLHRRAGLDLDTPFEAIVPELAPESPGARPITVRHLLTRTSGLQDPRNVWQMRNVFPWEELAAGIRKAPRLFAPGAVFCYGGVDRLILAVLLQRFAGTSLGRLTREIAVDPAKVHIRDIQYGPAEADGFRPIETFDTASLLDIVVKLTAPDAAAENPFSDVLRRDLRDEQLPLSRSVKAQPWPHAPTAFTLGLFKYSDGLIGFNGWEQNQSCAVRLDPQSGAAFVVALEGTPTVRDVVVSEVAQRMGFESVQSRAAPCTLGGLNGLSPQDIVGVYEGWAQGYEARVSVQDTQLQCELSYQKEVIRRLQARLEDEAWLVVDNVAQATALEFFRDEPAGTVCLAAGFLPYARSAA
jgi:CubicO group peptidase (beta-lactamase class C family)